MKPKSIVSIIVAAIGIVNLVLTACNVNPLPVDIEGLTTAVSTVMALVGAAGTTWYNFSITDGAKVADAIGTKLKNGDLTVKQVLDAIEDLELSIKGAHVAQED